MGIVYVGFIIQVKNILKNKGNLNKLKVKHVISFGKRL